MKTVFLRPQFVNQLFGSSEKVDHYPILKLFTTLSDMKRFIIPININNSHWILIDVEIEVKTWTKKIIFYDPFHQDIKCKFTDTVQAFFDVHFPELLEKAWEIQNCKDIQKQIDGSNCGVFVILYAYRCMVQCETSRWFEDLKEIRKKLISVAIKFGNNCAVPPFSTDDEVQQVPPTISIIYPVIYFSGDINFYH